MKTLRQLMGERLKKLREAAHLTELQLADITGQSRSGIYEIERGEKNVTLDQLGKLIAGCGYSPETLFASDDNDNIPHDLAWMLKTILKSKDPTLLDGIRVNLVAISRLALSLEKEARASPQRPPSREGQEPGQRANAGSQTESPRLKRSGRSR